MHAERAFMQGMQKLISLLQSFFLLLLFKFACLHHIAWLALGNRWDWRIHRVCYAISRVNLLVMTALLFLLMYIFLVRAGIDTVGQKAGYVDGRGEEAWLFV